MKVLFIAYYFPPYTIATPATRAVELIKNLKNLGVEPYILTQRGFVFGQEDHTYDEIIKEFRVYRVKMPRVKRVYGKKSLLTGILRGITWPDAYLLFIKKALSKAIRIIKQHGIDFIYTFAPPFSSLFLTYLVHKKTLIPYGIDMQDAWKEDLYGLYKSPLQKKLTHYYERRIFKKARLVTAINMPMVAAYRSQYNLDNVYFLPFGYSEKDVSLISSPENAKKLRFLYAGTLGGCYKDPRHLFNAMDLFFSKHYGARVEFFFVGNKTEDVEERLRKFPRDEVVSLPYIEKKEIVNLVNKAHVLLLLSTEGRHSNLVSTSKVYELINMKRPLFAMLTEDWLHDFVRKYTPFVAKWDDEVGIAHTIEQLYRLWQQGTLSKYALWPKKEFSYEKLAEKLMGLIKAHAGR